MGSQLQFKIFARCLEKMVSSIRSNRTTMESVLNRLKKSPQALLGCSEVHCLHALRDRVVEVEKEFKDRSCQLLDDAARLAAKDSSKEASTTNFERFRDINGRLALIEKKVKNDLKEISRNCVSLINDGIIEDYEIECRIYFSLDEDDPDYLENDDNLMAVLKFDGKQELDSDFGLGDSRNHNLFQQVVDHPMQDDHHCYLFHCLYDHTNISWEQILRIDMVWLEMIVRHQNFIHLKRLRGSYRPRDSEISTKG